MSLSYTDFSNTLAGLTVTGVSVQYTYTPSIDTSGNYPMMFPRVPGGEREVISLSSAAGLSAITLELVIVVERDTIGTALSKYAETIALIDALDAALATEMAANNQIDRWAITPEINEYGWSIVASVEGS